MLNPERVRAEERTPWFTGARLRRQRQQPLSVVWKGVAIRNELGKLARFQQVGVLLDRRIDPNRAIDLIANDVPFDRLLDEVAEKIDGGATWLGPLAYLGPRDAAARLRTLAALRSAEVHTLPKEKRSAFEREESWQWDDLAEPRQLVAALAATAQVELEAVDLVGHDLWPAADLPPLSWTDRLTLVVNEFDLGFEFVDAGHVRLMPIANPVVIERTYPGGRQAQELVAHWKQLAPEAEIEIHAGKLVVRARLEDHERLRSPASAPAAVPRPGAQVYTLSVPDQPLSAVLDKLREASIEIAVDEAALKAAGLTVDRRVSFSVERASLEELLAAALKPAGLTFRRAGNTFKIIPAPATDARRRNSRSQ